jgi:glycosyltransferase involved in cell wall biosynthesis
MKLWQLAMEARSHKLGSSVCQRWFHRFSLDLLRGLQTMDSHVVVVELSRNWGHMGAISAGIQTARGDAVILMDGDFQDPPEVLAEADRCLARGR